MQVNIKEILGSFFVYITTSLNEDKTSREIKKYLPELSLSHQVMIDVPEVLRKLTFTITTKGSGYEQFSIIRPIPINQYFFNERKKMVKEQ